MTIFQKFSRNLLGMSALVKARNAFTIGGGDLKAYHQTSRTVEPACNTIRNVAAHQGSSLSNFKKNPLGSLCFRGEGRLSFHTLRYSPYALFAPLREEQAASQLPVHARRFSRRREKQPSTMPDRNRNISDHKRRLLVAKYEVRRKVYKALCRDPELSRDPERKFEMRKELRAMLSKLPRNSALSRVRNRCIMSGRGRAVYKKFRLSRILFRQLANQGQLVGVKKASW